MQSIVVGGASGHGSVGRGVAHNTVKGGTFFKGGGGTGHQTSGYCFKMTQLG